MRAALLRETIVIQEVRRTISERTGAEKTEYVDIAKIKAYRKKISASVGTGVSASEQFIANTLVFQVRKYSFINKDIQVRYGGEIYKVTLIDSQRDNTYLLTCSKKV